MTPKILLFVFQRRAITIGKCRRVWSRAAEKQKKGVVGVACYKQATTNVVETPIHSLSGGGAAGLRQAKTLKKRVFWLAKPVFPCGKAILPFEKAQKPFGKPKKPLGKCQIPLGKPDSPNGKPKSPKGKSKFPNGKPTFPMEKSEIPSGKNGEPRIRTLRKLDFCALIWHYIRLELIND